MENRLPEPMAEAKDENTQEDLSLEEDEAVDGGYGWVNVACMQLLTGQTWGVNGVSICLTFLDFRYLGSNLLSH